MPPGGFPIDGRLFLDAGFMLLVAALLSILGGSIHRAAVRLGWSSARRYRLLGGYLAVVATVLCLDAVASASGWTVRWTDLPPRIPALALSALFLAGAALATRDARALLEGSSGALFVGFQIFRLPLELILFALHRQGRLPVQMTFEGRNLDVLVGLTAPLVAWALSRGKIGWRTVLVWNLASVCLLVNITTVAVRSAPGPLFAFPEAVPNTLVALLPYVWLPGVLVPVAYLGHFLSIGWALRERRRGVNVVGESHAPDRDERPARTTAS